MRVSLSVARAAPSWAHSLVRKFEIALNRPLARVDERLQALDERLQALEAPTAQPVPQYAVADKPDATAFEGHIIYITDTNRFAGSDGTNWVYLSDEVAV